MTLSIPLLAALLLCPLSQSPSGVETLTPERIERAKEQLRETKAVFRTGLTGLVGSPVEHWIMFPGSVTDEDLRSATPVIAGLLPHVGLSFSSANRVTREGWKELEKFPKLRALLLVSCPTFTEHEVQQVGRLVELEVLALRNAEQFTDTWVQHLASLAKLRILSLEGCVRVSDASLALLGKHSALEELRVSRAAAVTSRGVLALRELGRLRYLSMRDCVSIGDDAIEGIAAMPSLRRLDLSRCAGFTAAGVAKLARLERLQDVELQKLPVSDAVFEAMAAMTDLKRLVLTSTAVSDEGLRHLAKCQKLEELDLYGCSAITDAGLQHVAALKALKILVLHGCPKVTQSAVDRIQLALPECDVSWSPD